MKNLLDDFLKKSKSNNEQITHTRIGDKNLNVYGGKYNIKLDSKSKFLELYYNHVFENGKQEYLTEKQLIDNGPIMIDIDMRYESSVEERQHTKDHIVDAIMLYINQIQRLVDVEENVKIPVFVMEKSHVNVMDDKTKDGIHIIIGLKMHKVLQVMIREKILTDLKDMWDDLPLTNSAEDLFDEGITKGYVNWQLYGSRKPGHKAYLIKYFYNISYSKYDDDWSIDQVDIKNFDTKKYLPMLSARYSEYTEFPIKEEIKEEYEKYNNSLNLMKKSKLKTSKSLSSSGGSLNFWELINNKYHKWSIEDIDNILNNTFDNINPGDYELLETHRFTMLLPEKYYGPGSYNAWLRVGWALKNTNSKLFLTWMKFSSQSEEFDFDDIQKYYEMWDGFDHNNPDSLTNRSIMYWVKMDAHAEYKQVRSETKDYFIEQTVTTSTEFDLANVLYQIYKDEFVCISIKNNVWYEYKNHRWYEIDSGNTLRLLISKMMHDIYLNKTQEAVSALQKMDADDENYDVYRRRSNKLADICILLKKTNWKNNIMREARELFYDKHFINNMDNNPFLLCFNNYVIDFKNKIHRKGKPDDYISKCTNIDFIELNEKIHGKSMKEINAFMEELFPVKELRDYMWQHLASCLIGTNENQTFNIYTGSGRNGKSKLVDLMSKGLGDYKGTVPITLITQKRNSIGGTSSEVVQLMGTRYAVMQEPTKGDVINEGIMKEITGGDPIQGRALFKESVTFIPQFKLVVCTNTLFDIKSNDDGTWRRIRVCDFMSKFLDKPYTDEIKFPKEQYPYQYPVDRRIEEKFNIWAPVFMAMLVKIAYQTLGNVKDEQIVLASGDQYREGQDYFSAFVKEKIQKQVGGKIKKTELMETFKQWYTVQFGRGVPKGRELHEFMDNRYGKYNKGGWHNVGIIYDEDEDDLDDEC